MGYVNHYWLRSGCKILHVSHLTLKHGLNVENAAMALTTHQKA